MMNLQTTIRILLALVAALFLGAAVAQQVPQQEAQEAAGSDTEQTPP